MKTRFLHISLFALFLPLVWTAASAQTVPILYGLVEIASGDTPVTLLVVPDGSGPALTEVLTQDGQILDGTITLTLLDAEYNPIVNYPWEDIWLESRDDGLAFCYSAPTNPDENTDSNGQTTWTQSLHGGGWSQDLTCVMANGAALYYDREFAQAAVVNLQFNSPDINGDCVVNLLDLAEFVSDYLGVFNFRSDFHRDGVLDLLDVVIMAEAWGATCP